MPRRFISSSASTFPCTSSVLLYGAVSLIAAACETRSPIQPGDLIFGMPENEVLAVSFQRGAETAVARRSGKSASFRYRFDRSGSREDCSASAELDAAARRAFEVRAVKALPEADVERILSLSASELIELEVIGRSKGIDPFRLTLLPSNVGQPGQRIEAVKRTVERGFTVDPHLLDLFYSSCPKGSR